MLVRCFLLCFATGVGTVISRAETIEADVCVYAGTSGGVAAAVQWYERALRDRLLRDGQVLAGTT